MYEQNQSGNLFALRYICFLIFFLFSAYASVFRCQLFRDLGALVTGCATDSSFHFPLCILQCIRCSPSPSNAFRSLWEWHRFVRHVCSQMEHATATAAAAPNGIISMSLSCALHSVSCICTSEMRIIFGHNKRQSLYLERTICSKFKQTMTMTMAQLWMFVIKVNSNSAMEYEYEFVLRANGNSVCGIRIRFVDVLLCRLVVLWFENCLARRRLMREFTAESTHNLLGISGKQGKDQRRTMFTVRCW